MLKTIDDCNQEAMNTNIKTKYQDNRFHLEKVQTLRFILNQDARDKKLEIVALATKAFTHM